MLASLHGHHDVVKTLIEAGANVNHTNMVSVIMFLVSRKHARSWWEIPIYSSLLSHVDHPSLLHTWEPLYKWGPFIMYTCIHHNVHVWGKYAHNVQGFPS